MGPAFHQHWHHKAYSTPEVKRCEEIDGSIPSFLVPEIAVDSEAGQAEAVRAIARMLTAKLPEDFE